MTLFDLIVSQHWQKKQAQNEAQTITLNLISPCFLSAVRISHKPTW
jgi:hypothetical protein